MPDLVFLPETLFEDSNVEFVPSIDNSATELTVALRCSVTAKTLRVAQLEIEANECREECDRLDQENCSLNMRILELESAEKKLCSVEKELADVLKENQSLKHELSRSMTISKACFEEKKTIERKLAESYRSSEKISADVLSLERKLKVLRSFESLDNIEYQESDWRSEINLITSDESIEGLRSLVSDYHQKLFILHKECMLYKTRAHEMKDDRNKLKKATNELKEERNNLSKQMLEMQSKIAALQQRIGASHHSSSMKRPSLDELKSPKLKQPSVKNTKSLDNILLKPSSMTRKSREGINLTNSGKSSGIGSLTQKTIGSLLPEGMGGVKSYTLSKKLFLS